MADWTYYESCTMWCYLDENTENTATWSHNHIILLKDLKGTIADKELCSLYLHWFLTYDMLRCMPVKYVNVWVSTGTFVLLSPSSSFWTRNSAAVCTRNGVLFKLVAESLKNCIPPFCWICMHTSPILTSSTCNPRVHPTAGNISCAWCVRIPTPSGEKAQDHDMMPKRTPHFGGVRNGANAGRPAQKLVAQISLLQGWLNLEPNWRRGDLNHNHQKSWILMDFPTSMGHVCSISIVDSTMAADLMHRQLPKNPVRMISVATSGLAMHAVRING